jgi:hypothetical protein
MEEKKVNLAQIKEDLLNGLTRWKKDDIGFGSLEKKYNLTVPEMVQLLAHPKIKNIDSRIPTFVIVDDIPDEVITPTIQESVAEPVTKIEVAVSQPVVETPAPQRQTTIVVKQEQPKKKIEAFI